MSSRHNTSRDWSEKDERGKTKILTSCLFDVCSWINTINRFHSLVSIFDIKIVFIYFSFKIGLIIFLRHLNMRDTFIIQKKIKIFSICIGDSLEHMLKVNEHNIKNGMVSSFSRWSHSFTGIETMSTNNAIRFIKPVKMMATTTNSMEI